MPLQVSAIESKAIIPLEFFPLELARIKYDSGKLSIGAYTRRRRVALVQFESIEGFRVLDEGDLIEFWSMCSCSHGRWLWEIHEGGWFDLESTRPDFIGEKYKGATEYLVVGDNECVSVISYDRPVVKTRHFNHTLVRTPNNTAQSEY